MKKYLMSYVSGHDIEIRGNIFIYNNFAVSFVLDVHRQFAGFGESDQVST